MTAQSMSPLTEDESWEFLAGRPVGRLATSVAGEPEIFPVSFAVGDGRLYFVTHPGSKLAEVAVNARVAFEADEWTPEVATSVVIKGTAEILEHDADVAAAEATGLVSYLDDGKNVWVRITPEAVTGRRLTR
ncbi:nitroimidazol reductase NimA-like FMN-containing flavoprotein (pyridoxamine 5'-phosphate oxidase superfamily) [Isoptericola sp. CG 20/1183]|uniref:Nitroimidazol reductase NimA-like FMN-containing flavoprotein (Pyridoxamine 5'-phosphate oxidase superfamily) n=1 Tax=Isoptericola halotolerans TaxID=300560 RepID=A0ABX5ELW9_9MICO|nr:MULTISPECIES: pyridoxamine 5'-phosphate oxidase family protein [Isoptericola]MCK0118159.1 pyridoxamine 5'-phosphate oxidase family protein [Isoptericola sp. S6320L]PRZ09513.1 nitroimidazol reductase NimA-like FMN-containing flavoprotein (pyridoxamine 5'-phosphate oxidase superfamily) [Isoptericola sp. CG 20/1183]PRZ10314.1 nitroimidazol reductase NimA-like FMN-containing flavoprotein (pyridoxamine 5'-phosphate oxidase superfamily) [Isoptericola halotolerans]